MINEFGTYIGLLFSPKSAAPIRPITFAKSVHVQQEPFRPLDVIPVITVQLRGRVHIGIRLLHTHPFPIVSS